MPRNNEVEPSRTGGAPGVHAEPKALEGSATGVFGRRPVRRPSGHLLENVVGPGARGIPLTNGRLRRIASVTHIPAVRTEEAVVRNAERVMAVIEARDLWVSDAAARAEAALRAEATGEANGTVVTKVQKEKAA